VLVLEKILGGKNMEKRGKTKRREREVEEYKGKGRNEGCENRGSGVEGRESSKEVHAKGNLNKTKNIAPKVNTNWF